MHISITGETIYSQLTDMTNGVPRVPICAPVPVVRILVGARLDTGFEP